MAIKVNICLNADEKAKRKLKMDNLKWQMANRK